MAVSKRESRRFVEIVAQLLGRWGYSHTDGKIYAHLLLSERPLTISELAEATHLSRSSVSVSLSRLTRDYLVTYRKEGKTKYFSAVPAFLEKFLQQPKDILEREVRPLKEIIGRLAEKAESEEARTRFEGILNDLSTLECVLERIIKLEEQESDCIRSD
ncbi:helix-turn-helix domain-containing protein [Thermococcus pacificus]|uniref:HTH-type transcriptional regulator n=1 Tax=Thermococcus pacificus TaxID=71998 RepID=A0A218P7M4_9EURY|nr:helix-turn-helix domain-containing protein [Thermococcus pacificus]ASJ06769.1 transcriptional regulator [Thermococcus pacificus]